MTRDTLKRGDQGDDVRALQRDLIEAGYDCGPSGDDGDYGGKTEAAVLAFQLDRAEIPDTGIADPITRTAIAGAVADRPRPTITKPVELIACDDAHWAAFQKFVLAMTGRPTRYGPGRGLWDPETESWLLTYAAGRRTQPGDLKLWPNKLGSFFPSLHCTSLVNVKLSWLYRRNEKFTHAGNIPQLPDLVGKDSSLHQIPGGGQYRGFSEVTTRIPHDGSGAKRTGMDKVRRMENVMDLRELYERRTSLPTFLVWEMSSLAGFGQVALTWHHTGVLAIRDGLMFRLAADGRRDKITGYSGSPVSFTEITEKNLPAYKNYVFHAWGLDTLDGTYGDQSRKLAPLTFE